MKLLIVLCFQFSLISSLSAQSAEQDSLIAQKKHATLRPTIMSAVIPGLGQIHNGKFWKLPIVYGAFGSLIYLSDYNNKKYNYFSESYKYHGLPGPLVLYEGKLSKEQLLLYKKHYKRSRDLFYILIFGCYVLNVLDASVDANMLDYDISNDLSLKIEPVIFEKSIFDTSYSFGLTCRIIID